MTRKWIHGISLCLILAGGIVSADAKPHQSILYNKCSNGKVTCYCTHGCSADDSGCECNDH